MFTWWMNNVTSGKATEPLLRFLYDEGLPSDVGDAATRLGLRLTQRYTKKSAQA